MSVSSVVHGNRLFILQPNLHEALEQMQVVTITLPEDIEAMKRAHKVEQEQVGLVARWYGLCWGGGASAALLAGSCHHCAACAQPRCLPCAVHRWTRWSCSAAHRARAAASV
jgi:hypothetical protein